MTHTSRSLTPGQERLWFLHRLHGATGLYNEHVCVRMTGELNVPALTQSFMSVARRHESLRWTIREERGSCRAHPLAELPPSWFRTIDVSALASAPERERIYRQLASSAARVPFDLAAGPLFRVLLFRFSPREWAMAMIMHHIITDPWSMQVLVSELSDAYRAVSRGEAPASEPVDYDVRAERGTDAHVAYWRQALARAPEPVTLPTHRRRPTNRSFAGAKQYFSLGERAAAAIATFARQQRTTRFVIVLALWCAYLGLMTGRRDLVIGTTTAGRRGKSVESLIGFFANTLAIRTEVRSTGTLREYVRHVRAVALRGLEHEGAAFEDVVKALGLPRTPDRHPLFEVMFVYVNSVVLECVLPRLDVTLTPEDIDLGLCKFDLVLTCCDTGTDVRGLLDYSLELYDASDMRAHVERFQRLTAAALEHPDEAMRELMPVERAPAGLLHDLRGASFVEHPHSRRRVG